MTNMSTMEPMMMDGMNTSMSSGGVDMSNNMTMSMGSGSMSGMTMSSDDSSMKAMMMPSGMKMAHMGTMHDFFFASPDGQFYYLFEQLFIDTQGAMALACIVTVVFGIVATIVGKWLRQVGKYQANSSIQSDVVGAVASGLDLFIHYILMLLAMSFNIYILISISVGHGIGHLINRQIQKRMEGTDSTENANKSKTELQPMDTDDEAGGCH